MPAKDFSNSWENSNFKQFNATITDQTIKYESYCSNNIKWNRCELLKIYNEWINLNELLHNSAFSKSRRSKNQRIK